MPCAGCKCLGYTGDQDDMVTALVERLSSREGSHTCGFYEVWLCYGGRGTSGAQIRTLPSV